MKIPKILAIAALSFAVVSPVASASESGGVQGSSGAPTTAPEGAIIVSDQTQAALHSALKRAEAVASKSNPVTVWIPEGTYRLASTESLPPHTRLYAHPSARIVSVFSNQNPAVVLIGSPNNGSTGYTEITDVEVKGGIWDLGSARDDAMCSAFTFRHGDGITISNVTVENCHRHMINISGSKNVRISNSVFRNTSITSPSTFNYDAMAREAIHMDNTTVEHEGYSPNDPAADGTPAGDVTVENCLFENVYAGVGNHHTLEGKAYKYKGAKTLTVKGNTFKNVTGSLVNVFSMDNVIVADNTVSGQPWTVSQVQDSKNVSLKDFSGTVGSLVVQQGSQVTAEGLTVVPRTDTGILVQNSSVALANITVNNPQKGILIEMNSQAIIDSSTVDGATGPYAIQISSGSTGTISNCTVKNSAKDGIRIYNAGGGVKILNNKILDSGESGITVGGAPNIQISGNTSSSSKNVSTMKEITVWAGANGAVITNNCFGARTSPLFIANGMGVSESNNKKCSAPAPPPIGKTCFGQQVFRLYNPSIGGKHHYTLDQNEKNALVTKHGWKDEGVAWCAPKSGTNGYEVYRLYNPISSEHHYTMNAQEKDVLTAKHGWKYEGVAWYSDPAKAVELRRVYNPSLPAVASHHYTANMSEWNALVTKHGWKAEGTAWYGEKPL